MVEDPHENQQENVSTIEKLTVMSQKQNLLKKTHIMHLISVQMKEGERDHLEGLGQEVKKVRETRRERRESM